MKWKKVKLGDCCTKIQTGPFGSQLHQSDYADNGIPVIMPKDMDNGKISTVSIARVLSEHVERLSRHKVKNGDIVFSRRGDVGRSAFITEKENSWLCGTGCLKASVNDEKAHAKFVFYQLNTDASLEWFEKHAIGSTMLNLNTQILSEVPLSLPPLQTQKRIASILSAYDDLIENNQKQIKLLEEAAQRLYKEWFVDLRFPGHENVKIVDGVPEGWRLGRLDELAEFKRGKTITKDKVKRGKIPVIAGGLEPAYFHDVANTIAPVITVSASGANAGYTALHNEDVWASDCSFVDIKATDNIYFVYNFLKMNTKMMLSLQKGSAQPHVYAKNINELMLLISTKELLWSFSRKMEAVYKSIATKTTQISSLREARDRLLPKLMSGEIEV